jgi:hypothetical protein
MASVPVDPILTWKKPDWGFAIVVKQVNGEILNQRIRARTRKGSAIYRTLSGSNEELKRRGK